MIRDCFCKDSWRQSCGGHHSARVIGGKEGRQHWSADGRYDPQRWTGAPINETAAAEASIHPNTIVAVAAKHEDAIEVAARDLVIRTKPGQGNFDGQVS